MSAVEYTDEERKFGVEDLFYSRTDERGVIVSGNHIFQEVSGYSWDELVGAPHKIIRHPLMPKGAFFLVWNRIERGKPTSAYVRNRAKDGSFYWVFANMTPTEDGYLSVRLKPVSDMRAKVSDIYDEALRLEQEDGLTPEQSSELICDKVADLGFHDYDEFSAMALNAEMRARDGAMGRSDETEIDRYAAIIEAVHSVEKTVGEVVSTFRRIRMVPSNMRIIATRLEPTGGPISTIAVNYAMMARDMEAWVQGFLSSEGSGIVKMRRAIAEATYLAEAARLQHEAAAELRAEPRVETPFEHEHECGLLDTLADCYEENALRALGVIAESARWLSNEQAEMKRYVTGLSSTRTLCRVESARLGDDGSALDGIVESLDEFQGLIDGQLTDISRQNLVIRNHIDVLLEAGSPSSGRGAQSLVA